MLIRLLLSPKSFAAECKWQDDFRLAFSAAGPSNGISFGIGDDRREQSTDPESNPSSHLQQLHGHVAMLHLCTILRTTSTSSTADSQQACEAIVFASLPSLVQPALQWGSQILSTAFSRECQAMTLNPCAWQPLSKTWKQLQQSTEKKPSSATNATVCDQVHPCSLTSSAPALGPLRFGRPTSASRTTWAKLRLETEHSGTRLH